MSNCDCEYLVRVYMPDGVVLHTPYRHFKDAKSDLEESFSDGAEKVLIYKVLYSDSK